ncbi:hypothetical protein COBT_003425, partial [Conglomerata obtusa]
MFTIYIGTCICASYIPKISINTRSKEAMMKNTDDFMYEELKNDIKRRQVTLYNSCQNERDKYDQNIASCDTVAFEEVCNVNSLKNFSKESDNKLCECVSMCNSSTNKEKANKNDEVVVETPNASSFSEEIAVQDKIYDNDSFDSSKNKMQSTKSILVNDSIVFSNYDKIKQEKSKIKNIITTKERSYANNENNKYNIELVVVDKNTPVDNDHKRKNVLGNFIELKELNENKNDINLPPDQNCTISEEFNSSIGTIQKSKPKTLITNKEECLSQDNTNLHIKHHKKLINKYFENKNEPEELENVKNSKKIETLFDLICNERNSPNSPLLKFESRFVDEIKDVISKYIYNVIIKLKFINNNLFLAVLGLSTIDTGTFYSYENIDVIVYKYFFDIQKRIAARALSNELISKDQIFYDKYKLITKIDDKTMSYNLDKLFKKAVEIVIQQTNNIPIESLVIQLANIIETCLVHE